MIVLLAWVLFLPVGGALRAQDAVFTSSEPAAATPASGGPSEPPATAEMTPKPASPVASGSSAPVPTVPSAFPLQRYSGLMDKSPFALATAAPEQAAPAENFATNWVLTGISKKKGKEGSEDYTVFVRSRDLSIRHVISKDKPTDDGVTLVSVDEAPIATKSSVTLRKGSETGRVEFDQAVVAASASAPPPQQAGQPGAPGTAAKPAVRNVAKTAPIPRPGMQGSVPRPGASQGVPAPTNAPIVEPRRRVQPIQGPP